MKIECAALLQYRQVPSEENFRILYRKYTPLMFNQIAECKNNCELSHEMQSAYGLICYQTAHLYCPSFAVTYGTYLKSSLQKHRYSWLRQRYAQKRGSGQSATSLNEAPPATALRDFTQASPLDNIIIAETLTELRSRLSPAELQVFECLYYDNLSVSEIAAQLHQSTTWVYNTKARLKEKLRQAFT